MHKAVRDGDLHRGNNDDETPGDCKRVKAMTHKDSKMPNFRHPARGILLALATLSTACELAEDDSRPETPDVSAQSTVVGCCGATASNPDVDGLRLSLYWDNAAASMDMVAGNIYLTRYTSAAISIYDGNSWITRIANAESSTSAPFLGGLASDTTYDIFAYWSGTEVRIEAIPWTSGTGSALVVQDGVEVKSNDATRRYVGAVATESGGAIRDTRDTRHIWNRYNQVPRRVGVYPNTDYAQENSPTYDWTYANPNNTWRSAANDLFLPIKVLVGSSQITAESYASLVAQSMAYSSTGSGWFATGVGVDSSTVNSAQVGDLALAQTWSSGWGHTTAYYEGYLGPGKHTIRWLETGTGTSVTYTFLGHSRSAPFGKTGLVGWIMM